MIAFQLGKLCPLMEFGAPMQIAMLFTHIGVIESICSVLFVDKQSILRDPSVGKIHIDLTG
jgi:hypothetical protein